MRRRPTVFRLFVAAFIIWLAYVGMVLGVSIAERKAPPLKGLAFPLMNAAWLVGTMLLQSAQGLASSAIQRDVAVIAPPDPAVIALPVLTALGAACLGFSAAMLVALTEVGWLPQVLGQSWLQYAFAIVWSCFLAFGLFLGLTAVGRTNLKVHAWGRDRAEAAARAAADVERVRLVALQAQMNPQFLFNTLSTVAALAVPEPARAERVVEHLSTVLRHSLQRADQTSATVDDEMRFVSEYLAVEKERLGWRLRVTWAIDDETRDLRVPAMSAQTLVEEAIARGVESNQAGGDLRVTAVLVATGYLLRLSVEVDGPGDIKPEGKHRRLVDLRQRLSAEYERTFAFDQEVSPTGLRLSISIPAVRVNGETRASVESPS
jgi:hypothetical protein